VALTRDSQHLRLTVNVQIGLPGPILQGFIKLEDQISELNYRGTKSIIGDKVRDQFCNFAKKKLPDWGSNILTLLSWIAWVFGCWPFGVDLHVFLLWPFCPHLLHVIWTFVFLNLVLFLVELSSGSFFLSFGLSAPFLLLGGNMLGDLQFFSILQDHS